MRGSHFSRDVESSNPAKRAESSGNTRANTESTRVRAPAGVEAVREVGEAVAAPPPAALPKVRLARTADLTVPDAVKFIPQMAAEIYGEFLEDVRRRGIQDPLRVAGTFVVDGRHRLKAAHDLGLEHVPVQDVNLGEESVESYAIRSAIHRRHLTDDQRAMLAARLAKSSPLPRGGDRRSEKARVAKADQVGPTGGKLKRRTAVDNAAKVCSVKKKRVVKALGVLRTSPELAREVCDGRKTLAEARKEARIAKAGGASAESITPAGLGDHLKFVVAPLLKAAEHVAAGSLDAIIADFGGGDLRMLDRTLALADHALRPEGTAFIRVDQEYLREALNRRCSPLEYKFLMAHSIPRGFDLTGSEERAKGYWKSILVFGRKGENGRRPKDLIANGVVSEGAEIDGSAAEALFRDIAHSTGVILGIEGVSADVAAAAIRRGHVYIAICSKATDADRFRAEVAKALKLQKIPTSARAADSVAIDAVAGPTSAVSIPSRVEPNGERGTTTAEAGEVAP